MLLQKKSIVEGIHVIKDDHIKCVACALGKQHRKEFPNHEEKRHTELLKLKHTDVCGPMQTRSLGGAWYFLIFVDDRSRFIWVYFLRRKDNVFEYFKEFKIKVEKKTCKHIKILTLDQGGEYTFGSLRRYCPYN